MGGNEPRARDAGGELRKAEGEERRAQGVDDDEAGIAEDVEAAVHEGNREPEKVHNFVLPSRTEMDLHMLTHVPFRSWCEHCAKGRGEGVRHDKVGDVPEQAEVHMDFCFMGDEGQEKKLVILAVRRHGKNAYAGRPPITTKLVDVDKGRGGEVLIRSRLVARDLKVKNDDRGFDVFAAAPSLEMK